MLDPAPTKTTVFRPSDPAMLGEPQFERVEGDFYPTPQENVNCLARFVDVAGRTIWEPACGEGHISKRLLMLGAHVLSTDLYARGYGHGGVDFLKTTTAGPKVQAIITNPPYADMAEKFVRHALELMRERKGIVAMFLRNEWDMASTGRNDLFAEFCAEHPAFAMKICVTKRPRWIEGSKGSPRHSYAWYVWDWSKPADQAATIHYIHPRNA